MSDVAKVRVVVNDQPREIAFGSTIADLVSDLDLQPSQVAVERNKQLVRRAQHAETRLEDGDRLEVVTFFGGG